jgi:hypothetical protein
MNWYRNAFYHAQNKMKKDFQELVYKQLGDEVISDQFTLDIGIYYKNASCDGANIAALIEKFTLDALQENKTVVNDNVKYHVGSSWKILGQDKNNPRCEISITKKLTEETLSA